MELFVIYTFTSLLQNFFLWFPSMKFYVPAIYDTLNINSRYDMVMDIHTKAWKGAWVLLNYLRINNKCFVIPLLSVYNMYQMVNIQRWSYNYMVSLWCARERSKIMDIMMTVFIGCGITMQKWTTPRPVWGSSFTLDTNQRWILFYKM